MNLLFIEFDFSFFFMMTSIFIIMYFGLIKPKQKKVKEQVSATYKQTGFNNNLPYKCPFCNNFISIEDVFCTHCGNKLSGKHKEIEAVKICPKCKTPLGENDRFCHNCGEVV